MDEVIALPGLRVSRVAPHPLHVLHCDPADAKRAGAAIGIDLPLEMLRAGTAPGPRALHLAPDEWLLIGWTPPTDLSVPVAHALVDVSSRNLTLEIEGERAEALLSAGCPLDLSLFELSSCTRTLFGKAQIMLERRKDCFRMQYARSFDAYVIGFVRTAAPDLPKPG